MSELWILSRARSALIRDCSREAKQIPVDAGGQAASIAFFARHGIITKKDRPRTRARSARRREAGQRWFYGQLDLDPERLVFDDEWTATNSPRSHARCPKGGRLSTGIPADGHLKATMLVADLHTTGMIAPMVLDGPINGDWFEACQYRQ
jgi:hypothetical protein